MLNFKKGDAKMVMLVMLGVIGAGYVMNLGREMPVVGDAINGFDA